MKKLGLIGAGFFVIFFVSLIEIHIFRLSTISLTTRIILLIFFNFNILALSVLMFYVGKNLLKVYIERRQRVLGSKFKTKIVLIFVTITSIPSALLFFGSSGLVTRYIDRWFSPQFRQPIESSLSIAKEIYDTERNKTLSAARAIASGAETPQDYSVTRLSELPDNPSDLLRDAFEGKEGIEVVSGDEGDTVRAVVPDKTAGVRNGVIVVESFIPKNITRNVDTIKDIFEEYMQLEALKQPLFLNYIMISGFFTLIVIFMALWVSLRLARGITTPIQGLAEATEKVASGNLDVHVDISRDDEIGLLIDSFNHMVRELKEGKESLQASYTESNRRRLTIENILENIQSGVISLDAEGNVNAINNAACAILNVTPHDVIGKNYQVILSAIKSDSLQEFVLGINLRFLQRAEREVWATIRGKRRLIKISITGLRDSNSEYLGLLVVFDDLTDVIRAQRALAWQEVAKRIAHEIKNPLTPIKLSTERMLRRWEHGDSDFGQVFERSTRTIIKEVDGLKKLVDEFSRFGKMPEIQKVPAALGGIIDEVVTLYKEYRDVRFDVVIPREAPLIEIDCDQFRRVLINLFDNAIQAMRNSGIIEIRTVFDLSANRVSIEIADNGPGIREEDKEKLFLPYFSTKESGTGLGLAIASRIISDHRGYLRVRDNEPRGTVFIIDMPIRESAGWNQ
jgi:two-component system, NtrC family, nitrogen regulation sensor histidine kinase NtrY